MAWEENSRICLHMHLIAILSRIGVGMTPCHEQSLMAFDVKGNSQLLAKYVMEILRERLALKKDKVTME